MVYPICFNIRHGIEISLKHFLSELKKLYGKKQQIFYETKTIRHNIKSILNDYCDLAAKLDARLEVMAKKLAEFIKPWADIDATGQTFRYAFSNDAQKHLTEYAIIDLFKVTLNLESLKAHLEDNFALLEELDVEYDCNSYTKNLSRWDLRELASELPLRANWVDALNDVKRRWCTKRKLSTNEFSQACRLIESHWEFSNYIGLEVPLLGRITSEDLTWAVEQSMHFDGFIHELTSNRYDDSFFDTLFESNMREEAWHAKQEHEYNSGKLTPELVATVSSLYYNNRQSSYCEDYRSYYERDLKNLSSKSRERLIEEFAHVIRKGSFISGLVDGLRLLNQTSTIEKLKEIKGIYAHLDETALLVKQSKTERNNDWYASLPKLTKLEKFLASNPQLQDTNG